MLGEAYIKGAYIRSVYKDNLLLYQRNIDIIGKKGLSLRQNYLYLLQNLSKIVLVPFLSYDIDIFSYFRKI